MTEIGFEKNFLRKFEEQIEAIRELTQEIKLLRMKTLNGIQLPNPGSRAKEKIKKSPLPLG